MYNKVIYIIYNKIKIITFQIHPHGHAALSRNISYDEKTEWSCVHDLHEELSDSKKGEDDSDDDDYDDGNLRTFLSKYEKNGSRKRKRIADNYESRQVTNQRLINSSTESNSRVGTNNSQSDSDQQDTTIDPDGNH